MLNIEQRLELLAQVAQRLQERRRELVAAEAEDIGAPYWVGNLELDMAIEHLQTMRTEVPSVIGKYPYGTVAATFPYDAPAIMLARVGGAAILGGNRFRFSFSSQTPRTAAVMADIVRPFEPFQAIVGLDNRRFGTRCLVDPEVRVFFISGGGEVGKIYRDEIGHLDKLFFAGPSGMPAALLFADAPVEQAVRYVVRRAYINGGQYCTTIKKAYINAKIYDQVKASILALMPEIKVGDPEDEGVWIGPMKVERTRQLLHRAIKSWPNPHFLLPLRLVGEWIGPLLLEAEDAPDLEMFGPFLALIKVADDAEALAQVQQTRYPFAVSYFGTPPHGGAEQLKQTFGMVYGNPDFTFTPLRLPFGGKKESGWIVERRDNGILHRDGAFIYSAELVHD